MQTVLIVIHLMIVIALVGVVLLQRSEGGGLGIGGGSGFMSARGAANALTRTTAILATLFFITSLGLGLVARYQAKPTDILDRIPTTTTGEDSLLNQLGPATTEETKEEAPAAADDIPIGADNTNAAKPQNDSATDAKPADATATDAQPADAGAADQAPANTQTEEKPAAEPATEEKPATGQ
jgi:preprotein translocase subunit SecG